MKALHILLAVCILLIPLLLIGGIWWWALFGMSEEIGTAWGVTITVVIVALVVSLGLTAEITP